jgi:4a-hydroxytetrahydrobiopterin dehydratase
MNATNMWNTIDGKLCRTFEFKNFIEAFAFVTKVALISERLNHHPEIRIQYNIVTLSLCTHDEENKITEKDRHTAERIDQAYKLSLLQP